MRYENDPEQVRSAREEKKKAEDDIAIANIQKEIDLIQKSIDALNEHKEALQEELEQVNAYYEELIANTEAMYDSMIKETEEYWDSVIEGLEGIKSKWEELAEIETVAKAWGELGPVMEELGYTVEDVLNDTPGAFEAFKAAYVEALANANAENKHFIQGLQDASGQTVDNLGKINDAANETKDKLSGISEATPAIDETKTHTDDLGKSVENIDKNAEGAVSKLSTIGTAANYADIAQNITTIADQLSIISGLELSHISDPLKDISTAVDADFTGRITTITYALQQLMLVTLAALAENTQKMKEALDETTVANASSLRDAINIMSAAQLGQLIGQMSALKDHINSIATMLGVNAEGAVGGIKQAIDDLNAIDLTPAFDQFKKLKEAIDGATSAITGEGAGGEEEQGSDESGMNGGKGKDQEGSGEGDGLINAINKVKETADTAIGDSDQAGEGTAIGDFNALGSVVDDLTENRIGKVGEGGEPDKKDSLTGAIFGLHEMSSKKIPEIKGWFDELLKVIKDCATEIANMAEAIGSIVLPDLGGGGGHGGGHYTQYTGTAHAEGTAKLSGDWSIKHDETALTGELGQELVIRNGKYFTVGDHGPEFTKLKRGDVVLNHLQTREILDKKNQIHAYAQGTLPKGFSPITDDAYSSLALNIKEGGLPTMSGIASVIDDQTRQIQSTIQNVNTATTNVEMNSTFNISGVTGEDVARQINTTLQTTFMGFANNTRQYAKTR